MLHVPMQRKLMLKKNLGTDIPFHFFIIFLFADNMVILMSILENYFIKRELRGHSEFGSAC